MIEPNCLSPVVVAIDKPDAASARVLVNKLDPSMCRIKVGKELFTAAGPELVREFVAAGYDVFLDLKFHDIPNTVAKAIAAAADLGVWMVNVHASGGREMMQAARAALANKHQPPLLIAVTVLTSMNEAGFADLGVQRSLDEQVLALAGLAQQSGLDGVVCSAQEAASLKQQLGEDFCLVTPGVRPIGANNNDQKRVMTPANAMAAGSHYLVIGRPITEAKDPKSVLKMINTELGY